MQDSGFQDLVPDGNALVWRVLHVTPTDGVGFGIHEFSLLTELAFAVP